MTKGAAHECKKNNFGTVVLRIGSVAADNSVCRR